MKRRNFLKLGAGATSIAIAGCASREGEGNYPSESISFYGYDAAFFAAAQALSQYLPEHLPNDVDIVVEQPDGWITGTANLYNAQPDGYTIGWGNLPGTLAVQKVRDSQFDMTEMSWLAHAETLVHWVLVRGDSEFNSLEDLQNADEVSFASLGGSSAEIGLIIGMNEMDVNYNTVNFSSASECIAALSRGDVDAVQFPEYGPPVMNALDGNAELLLTYREEPPEVNPDAQTVASAGYDNLIDLGVNRLIGAPPDLDSSIRETLTNSLTETMESDEFVSWNDENNRNFDPRGPDYCDEIFETNNQFIEENMTVLEEALSN